MAAMGRQPTLKQHRRQRCEKTVFKASLYSQAKTTVLELLNCPHRLSVAGPHTSTFLGDVWSTEYKFQCF